MLEKHMANGMKLDWLQEVYKPELKGFGSFRWELKKGIVKVSASRKGLFSTKTTSAIWLPYVPGAINYAISQGLDVISGPFTGCIMAAYTKRGGERRVCHVSTFGEPKYDCKDLWNTIKEDCASYVEYRPASFYHELSKKKRNLGTVIFGIITGDDRCYGCLVKQSGNGFVGGVVVKMNPTKK